MTSYVSRLAPRAHQVEALNKARGKKAFGYLMDMGTGKSKVICDEFGEMERAGEIRDLLIFAPAGCYTNWVLDKSDVQIAEIRKHFSEDLYDRAVIGYWRSGLTKTHREALRRLLRATDRPRVLVVNVEAANVNLAQRLCKEFLAPGRAMVVVDESPTIKNPDAARTKVVVNFGLMATYRRILTGLVAPNGPMDMYSQFEFLDWKILGHKSYFGFRARYAVLKDVQYGGRVVLNPDGTPVRKNDGSPLRGPGGPEDKRLVNARIIVNYRHEDELAEKIAPHTFRKLKEECLDLPPRTYMTRDVDMTDEQHRVYKELKEQATSQLASGEHVSAQMALTLMMRLHQVVCGHVTDEEGIVRPLASYRIDALVSALAEHPRKAIVWANYDYSIRTIVERLKQEFGERSVAAFWGGNRKDRGEEERRFLGDPECRFMVSTQSAGGRGNTWVVADLNLYFSSDYDLDRRAQSEDRPYRDGQTMPLTNLDLCAWGTVDEKILKALRKKINIAGVISGDTWREWVV